MKKTTSILAIILSVFVWSNSALAKAEKWEIDKGHSSIYLM